ncbi:DNA-processing protein DprA [Mycobacterium sp. GA-2829]|uniref:DNA-processing protein DprA n=1 Tax=Mycobacterium sp. GA-2829 TaxID=1772283 RepID=UPI0007404B86|nr:DNA-processing protein DprA [Mycobacterium sp. GA-2829]KUI26856.1 DNA processing protein DprA [Mycobacterium sp. GA-2829]
MSTDVERAWAYLSRVAEPPCPELADLVATVGPVEAADKVRRADLDNDRLKQRTEARREHACAQADLGVLARLGGRLITESDDEWPLLNFMAFDRIEHNKRPQGHAPLVLWAVGDVRLDEVAHRSAAIVGTRAATAYGEHVAADLAAGLAMHDVAVVSGGAFGIDGAAHRATLASDGVTVAVVAGGLDVPYPAGHAGLLRRIAEEGLVLSEYPPGSRPTRNRFLTRNRLVAALSGATVVVEAGARSGAANTAAWAEALGQSVCVVPGPVTSGASVGCHRLLRRGQGATLVTCAEEVIEMVGRIGELAPEEQGPSSPLDGLSDTERRVYDALPKRGARSADEVAFAAGIPAHQVIGPLAMLEVAGLVVHEAGRWKVGGRR